MFSYCENANYRPYLNSDLLIKAEFLEYSLNPCIQSVEDYYETGITCASYDEVQEYFDYSEKGHRAF
jgi:hypothetical protein